MGDDDPWTRHIPTAWQAASTASPVVTLPRRPGREATHDELAAWWCPLLHLLIYGLGWRRPDRGLAAWQAKRWPLEDPILRLVDNWSGQDGVLDFLAWVALRGGVQIDFSPYLDHGIEAASTPADRLPDTSALSKRRESSDWRRSWGAESAPLRLMDHVGGPMVAPPGHGTDYFDSRYVSEDDVHAIPRFQITSESYAGWYGDFFHYMPHRGANGRSVRTEVVVKPIGWMGEFRRHSATGLWFRGRSFVHLWGQ